MIYLQTAFYYLIFPGIIFCFTMGALGFWVERKLTARFQYRIGPPWYQNFIDVAKLFCKETLIPQNANRLLFVLSPITSLCASIIFSLMVMQGFFLKQGFIGDILVMLYLVIVPSIFVIIGAFASNNPLALVGATREIKLMLAYEFVFIVSLLIPIIKSNFSLTIIGIGTYQANNGPGIGSISGIIGFILALAYLQAKLGIVPFDMAEAEQEIMAGTVIEYSGPLLGFYKISKLFLYFSLPLLVIFLFWYGRSSQSIYFLIKYALVMLVISVVKNINPRYRIKDALKFFWFFLFPLGLIGVFLALKGL
jgi:NADH-quinone oxidoreductase subunit H